MLVGRRWALTPSGRTRETTGQSLPVSDALW